MARKKKTDGGAWLTPVDAAKRLGVSVGALENLRRAGQAPKHELQGRFVRYDAADVETWVRQGAGS